MFLLPNDRTDAMSTVELLQLWKIYSLKYPMAELILSTRQDVSSKNIVMIQPCPQGPYLVAESLDLHHALDLCRKRAKMPLSFKGGYDYKQTGKIKKASVKDWWNSDGLKEWKACMKWE